MQLHHVSGDAAESERSLDATVNHLLTDVLHGSQRGAARTRLNGEAVAEVAAVDDDLCSLLGEQDVAWVLRVADGTRRNLRRVAHRVDFHDEVNVVLRDGVRRVRIRHEVVGENHHLVGILSIGLGISQRAADGLRILRARVAAGVARVVG